MDHVKMLDKAKLLLLGSNKGNPAASPVFYSSILFSLKHVFRDDIGTASVDGKHLFISPKFWTEELKKDEHRVFLLAHECLHIAFRHLDYFEKFNRKMFDLRTERQLWNYAGDYVINLALVDAGYEMPPIGLYKTKYRGMSTLQVYWQLHDEYQRDKQMLDDLMDGMMDDIIFPEEADSPQNKRDLDDLRKHIDDIVVKANIQSGMSGEHPGSIPGEIQRKIQDVINPRLPFEVILANYMTAYGGDEYSFQRPNRRFLPDTYLPTCYSPRLCNITCAFDVSGSVTEKGLNSFATGVRMIQEQLRPEKITIIEFDTKLHGEPKELDQGTRITEITFHGGGGTDVTPVLEWAQKNNPEVLLIFTDGDFHMPDLDVPSDIIWIIHDNPRFTANKGKVFHYQL